ncbi:MAG: ATP-dependent DNA helicase [Gammaproteobacteria bacterium]|nr:MAG: ATP-dependent DNA helicase [Gammaproteobacteria bacterium]
MIDADPAALLGADGPFTHLLDGFAPRHQQQEMAAAVADAIDAGNTLVTEAGTGTGKTFAYLLPALLSGKKVVVSTGTRHLQDQLYHRDLPLVRQALDVPIRAALLKGRTNYLCRYRLQQHLAAGRFRSREQAAEATAIRDWTGRTRAGDIAELTGISEESRIWPLVTSNTDNCLGQECPDYTDCFLVRARRNAQAVDLLVVNHHLLFADMALRDSGFGELLPDAEAWIIDEAHQVPEIAGRFFGDTLSAHQLLGLARDTVAAQLTEAPDSATLRDLTAGLEKGVADLRLALGKGERRAAWSTLLGRSTATDALTALHDGLEALGSALAAEAGRGKGLESCARRTADCLSLLDQLGEEIDGAVRWVQTYNRGFVLNRTPLDIAEPLQQQMARYPGAWIFTSATLAVGDSFTHYTERLGLDHATTHRWESPFDFSRQALLYVPRRMPDPRDPEYGERLLAVARPLIEASGGRCFLLFTSHRALRDAAERLDGALDYPLLVQGDAPRAELLERFRALGNAVLLGTSSFWEGVDVRGEALSCVIIDKLPFAAPDDPVLQARSDALRAAGGNPFMDHHLPNAVIALKQGVGRLIRDVDDHGVLAICDPRLFSKSYGRRFLGSLPPMPVTRDEEKAISFFADVPGALADTGETA